MPWNTIDAVPALVFFGFFAAVFLAAHLWARVLDRREASRIPRARVAR